MLNRTITRCLRMPLPASGIAAICLAAVPLSASPPVPGNDAPRSDAPSAASAEDLDARIDRLIKQLGDSQYATRQRAKMELKRLRLEAFDALNEARHHDDIEIALSARYLVRSMQVNWWTDEDPREVKQLLRDYGQREEAERRNLMEQLAGLDRELSLRPLCRLVRYEASELLSKRAALLVLALEAAEGSSQAEYAVSLRALMGKSKRAAARWLRAYAALLEESPDFHERWVELIAQEREELAENPEQTSRAVARDLLNWYADRLLRSDRREESLAMMRQSIELLNPDQRELIEAADWLRQRGCWTVLAELAQRFRDTFRATPMLQYRHALALRELGRDEQAEEIAQVALEGVGAEPEEHLELAGNLQTDGLFEWAEREYRHVMAAAEEDEASAVRARLYLAEMLHDTADEKRAADVLRELVERMEAEQELRELVEESLGRELTSIKSRMHYFSARHYLQQEDLQRHRQELLEGVRNDPQDADVLIAMYRVPEADPQWREETLKRIEQAADQFRGQLEQLKTRLRNERSAQDKALARFQLALTYNQLAWLISNTEGDYDESLRCSQESLKLQPGRPGFLDTLGRCYFAKGDYENAVKYQEQAVAKEAHSPLMLAQLELFRQALREQREKAEQRANVSPERPQPN